MQRDLIAAVATPAGAGGIGIVRASGAGLSRLTALFPDPVMPPPRCARQRRFVAADGALIDDGLALYFPAPASFTGEDVLELHAHGGVFIMQRLLTRCLQLGARLAEPGEFTLRAYLNDKLELPQAEALADLINAGSEAAATAAARALAGEFSAAVAAFSARLRALRATIESDLDFSDDDALTADAATASAAVAGELLPALEALLEQTRQGARLACGADVVIAGAPNVGKSSLLNRLAQQDAAIVSDTPGTTRDTIERDLVIDGLPLRLTDTAGLRAEAAAVEQEGIRRAQVRLAAADVVLCLSTAELPPPLLQTAAARLEVCNKIDISGEAAGFNDGVYYISAKTGAGIATLQQAICAAVGYLPETAGFSARLRHVAALEAVRENLQQAAAAALPEVAAAWLRSADENLLAISGSYDDEDLLGDIFSRFCVGK